MEESQNCCILSVIVPRKDHCAPHLSAGSNHDMPMFSVFCHLGCHLVSGHVKIIVYLYSGPPLIRPPLQQALRWPYKAGVAFAEGVLLFQAPH